MNAKKIIALFMCMLMLTLIPVVAGSTDKPTNDPRITDIGFSLVRGFITKPQLTNGGHFITFRCISVHYMCRGIGHKEIGTLHMFQKITVENNFAGYIGNHFIMARFSGDLDI
jgi:hypothetical protein